MSANGMVRPCSRPPASGRLRGGAEEVYLGDVRCPLRVKTGKTQSEQMFSALPLIVLKKSFWGDERIFFRAADAFYARRREGPYRFVQNRPRTFVAVLNSELAAEKSKNQLSRDFSGRSIFDFCNSITPTTDIHHDDRDVRFAVNRQTPREDWQALGAGLGPLDREARTVCLLQNT
jgi:hypothetical protein